MARLEKEIWVAHFAAIIVKKRPELSIARARQLGDELWINLCMLTPKAGADTLIDTLNTPQPGLPPP